MLTYRLTNCEECNDIVALIGKIDCKITEMAQLMYSNISFSLGKCIDLDTIKALLHYKRILQYKKCNPEYAGCYSVEDIANKIKILIHK